MNGKTIVRALLRKFFTPESDDISFSLKFTKLNVFVTSFHKDKITRTATIPLVDIFELGNDLLSEELDTSSYLANYSLTSIRAFDLKVGDELLCVPFGTSGKVSGKVKSYKKFPNDFAFPVRHGNKTYWVYSCTCNNRDLIRFACNRNTMPASFYEITRKQKPLTLEEYFKIEVK